MASQWRFPSSVVTWPLRVTDTAIDPSLVIPSKTFTNIQLGLGGRMPAGNDDRIRPGEWTTTVASYSSGRMAVFDPIELCVNA